MINTPHLIRLVGTFPLCQLVGVPYHRRIYTFGGSIPVSSSAFFLTCYTIVCSSLPSNNSVCCSFCLRTSLEGTERPDRTRSKRVL
jgi:hypothetical protein